MRDYRNLHAWQRADRPVKEIYVATESYPRHEHYELRSQTRRSAVSIPANIAERAGRGSEREYRRFLVIATGSATELEYELGLGRDLGYLELEDHERLDADLGEVRAMLITIARRLHR